MRTLEGARTRKQMKKKKGRKGKPTPVSETAVTRRGMDRKVLCVLRLEHCIESTENIRRGCSFLNVYDKGTSWILTLRILLGIQVVQIKPSPHAQPGKHAAGNGSDHVQLLFGKGQIQSHSPGAAP